MNHMTIDSLREWDNRDCEWKSLAPRRTHAQCSSWKLMEFRVQNDRARVLDPTSNAVLIEWARRFMQATAGTDETADVKVHAWNEACYSVLVRTMTEALGALVEEALLDLIRDVTAAKNQEYLASLAL